MNILGGIKINKRLPPTKLKVTNTVNIIPYYQRWKRSTNYSIICVLKWPANNFSKVFDISPRPTARPFVTGVWYTVLLPHSAGRIKQPRPLAYAYEHNMLSGQICCQRTEEEGRRRRRRRGGGGGGGEEEAHEDAGPLRQVKKWLNWPWTLRTGGSQPETQCKQRQQWLYTGGFPWPTKNFPHQFSWAYQLSRQIC